MGKIDLKDEAARSTQPADADGASQSSPKWVVGPLGQRLTLEKLPRPGFRHWLPLRKAEVVAAVSGGLLTIDEALKRYNMTIEEYAGWERAVKRFGVHGLRTTRMGRYRDIQEREQKF